MRQRANSAKRQTLLQQLSAWLLDSRDSVLEAVLTDVSMTLMALGALFKFLELVVLRDDFSAPRFFCSIVGGVLIAAGSGTVTMTTLEAILADRRANASGETAAAAVARAPAAESQPTTAKRKR